MPKVLITCGPIPAKLDSVKFLTNRFKGGLAYKTAKTLYEMNNDIEITIVKWKYSEPFKTGPYFNNFSIMEIEVEDVMDYKDKVLQFDADVYILAAAVANLMPSKPWKGKFPSHSFKVGEKFDIEFEIAPRIIDLIKKEHPRSALVGYKLFDGSDEELINAAWETLITSKANIVFANQPSWAKQKKIMLTLDGSEISMTFEEHINWINRLIKAKYYSTKIVNNLKGLTEQESDEFDIIKETYPRFEKHGMSFGCFAYKTEDSGFITTSRGKQESGYTKVINVDHNSRIVEAFPYKATLNAPFLDALFKNNPQIKILIHGHYGNNCYNVLPYELPGTDQEVKLAEYIKFANKNNFYYISHHGFIAGFRRI